MRKIAVIKTLKTTQMIAGLIVENLGLIVALLVIENEKVLTHEGIMDKSAKNAILLSWLIKEANF